jgi:hypothetical protein
VPRPEIRLLFTTRDHPWDWGVRLMTTGDASHVAIALGPTGDPLVHATGEGVVIEPRARWLAGKKVVAEYRILPDVSDGLNRRVLPSVGKRFGHGLIAVRALERALKLVSWPTIRLPATNHNLICSQTVMLLDPDGARIPEWRDLGMGTVDPQQLLERAERGASFQRIR